MSKAEEAVRLARQIAADDSHGYDQTQRWGPDYDCSSLIITIWESVGVPVKSRGATYTGNMAMAFIQAGFAPVKDGTLKAGDVLLNTVHHTALYIGNGRIVQASINEQGRTTGGQPGDQTGREICETAYYDYPWDCVLRYTDEGVIAQENKTEMPTMRTELPLLSRTIENEEREEVRAFQQLLNLRMNTNLTVDGYYGPSTEAACRSAQKQYKIKVDGEAGAETWAAVIRGK